jgi:hypothetical protein
MLRFEDILVLVLSQYLRLGFQTFFSFRFSGRNVLCVRMYCKYVINGTHQTTMQSPLTFKHVSDRGIMSSVPDLSNSMSGWQHGVWWFRKIRNLGSIPWLLRRNACHWLSYLRKEPSADAVSRNPTRCTTVWSKKTDCLICLTAGLALNSYVWSDDGEFYEMQAFLFSEVAYLPMFQPIYKDTAESSVLDHQWGFFGACTHFSAIQ